MGDSARAKAYQRLYSADTGTASTTKSARAQAYERLYSQTEETVPVGPQRSFTDEMIFQTNRAAAAAQKDTTPDYGKGNIDLNTDETPLLTGNKYTVYTDTTTNEKVIIPAFRRVGFSSATQLTDEQAVEQYKKSGKYYAKFALPSASVQQAQDINNSFGIGALKTTTVDEQIAAYIKELQQRDTDRKIATRTGPLTREEFIQAAAEQTRERMEDRMGRLFGDADRNAVSNIGLAVTAGANNFQRGIANISSAYRKNTQAQAMDAGLQEVVSRERSQMDFGEGLVFDLVSNLVQNAPSMAMGAVTGSGLVNGAVMFATTFGNDLQYAEAAGHDAKKAYTYAFMDGIVQAFLEQIGVIPGAKGLTDTIMDGLTKNVHNAVGKFLVNAAGDMLGDGVEEMVQTALENGLKNAILGEKNNASLFSEEALYAALLGALSGGVMGTVNISVSNIASNTTADTQMRETVREMLENQVLESAHKCNKKKEVVKKTVYEPVARLAGELGVSVRFETAEEIAVRDQNGNVLDTPRGRYDRVGDNGTGTVVLNAEASTADAVEFLLKHELTHAIEGTAEWDTLVSAIRHAKGEERFKAEMQAKTVEYASKGIMLNERGAEQEVVADWVGQNLYREGFIDAVLQHSDANKAQSLVARFRSFFSRNKNTAQASQLPRLERLFRKGIENRRFVEVGAGTQYFLQNPSELTKEAGIALMEGCEHGEFHPKTFIPVSRTTPDIVIESVRDVVELQKQPMAMEVSKVQQMIEEADIDDGGSKLHGIAATTASDIFEGMFDPEYIVYQKNNQRIGVLVKMPQGYRGMALIVIDKGRNFNADLLNGYEGGVYNVSVTMFTLEDASAYLKNPDNVIKLKKDKVNREEAASSNVLSLSNDSPYLNTTVPQNGTGVNSYSMQGGGENSQYSFGEGDAQDLTTPVRLVTGNELAAEEAEQYAADSDDIALGHGSTAPVGGDIDTNRRNNHGVAVKLSEGFIEKTLARFGIEELNDYVHVQKRTLETLLSMGFFTQTETRSRVEINRQSGMEVEINKSSIDETFNYRNYATSSKTKKVAKIATLEMLPAIIREGTLVEDNVPDKHENAPNKKFAYIQYRTNVDGVPMVVKLAIKKSPEKNKLWVHTVHIEKDTSAQGEEPNKGKQRPSTNTGASEHNNTSLSESQADIPDAEDAMAEVEEKVSDSKKRKLTKSQEKRKWYRDDLLQEVAEGRISAEEAAERLDELEQEAIDENDKKWSTGKRGSAAEKQHAKNAVEVYSANTNTRLAQREQKLDRREQDIDKRKSNLIESQQNKASTKMRGDIQKTVDEITAKLARPSKGRFVTGDLVAPIQVLLDIFKESDAAVDVRAHDLRRRIWNATDANKKARLQKQLDNLHERHRLTTETLAKIRRAYKEFCKETAYGDGHKGVADNIYDKLDDIVTTLEGKDIYSLSYEDLHNVLDLVKGIAHQIQMASEAFTEELNGNIYERGETCIDEALEAEEFYGKTLLKYDFVKKLVNWQLSPDRFFKMLGGFKKDSVWERVYNSFKEGQKRYFGILREFDEYFKSITDHEEFKRLASTKPDDLVDIGLKDADGKPLLLTRGMMLSLYMQLTCNMEQVIWSGLEIPELKTYYDYGITKDAYRKGTRISGSEFCDKLWELTEQMKTAQTPADQSRIQEQVTQTVLLAQQDFRGMLENIRGKLTTFESDFIEKSEQWFNEVSKNHINEITTQVFGYPKAMVERYFRIRRDGDFVDTEIAGLAYNQTIESMGSLQARVKSKSPMLLTDLMDELTANCNDVARIVGFMAPETDFRRLYNVRSKDMKHSVKEVLRKFGSERGHVGVSANQYVENLLADLTFGRKFEQGVFGWFHRNSVRAVMTLNPRVAMIQLAAWPTAAAELGWKTVAKGTKYLFKKPPIDKINKYSIYGYMRNRGDGGMQEFSTARQGHGFIDRAYNWVDDKTKGRVLGLCQKVDQWEVNSQWYNCEDTIRETRPDLKVDSEEYYKAVGELMDEVIIKTQSNGTTLEKPDLLRNKGAVMKTLTMFKTDSMQQFGIGFEGVMTHRRYAADFKAGKNGVTAADVAAAKHKMANSLTGVVVGGIFCATILRMLANFLLQNTDKYRDEDGELTASSVTLAAASEMVGSMAGLVTFGDYIYEVIEARLFGQRYYGISDMGLETLSDVLNTVATGDLSEGKTWGKLALNLSDALGIPVNNVKKMWDALAAHAEDIKNGEFLSLNGGYEASASQYYSRLYKALMDGEEERAERLRRTLEGMEKTDAEILAGLRAAIKKSDKQFESIFDEMFADVRTTTLYERLTEKEKKKVQSGISGYVADTLLADISDSEMTAQNQKAAKYAKKGVPEADYFLAQVVKNAFFADTNEDDKVSKAEYAAALDDGGYSETVRRMLLALK